MHSICTVKWKQRSGKEEICLKECFHRLWPMIETSHLLCRWTCFWVAGRQTLCWTPALEYRKKLAVPPAMHAAAEQRSVILQIAHPQWFLATAVTLSETRFHRNIELILCELQKYVQNEQCGCWAWVNTGQTYKKISKISRQKMLGYTGDSSTFPSLSWYTPSARPCMHSYLMRWLHKMEALATVPLSRVLIAHWCLADAMTSSPLVQLGYELGQGKNPGQTIYSFIL